MTINVSFLSFYLTSDHRHADTRQATMPFRYSSLKQSQLAIPSSSHALSSSSYIQQHGCSAKHVNLAIHLSFYSLQQAVSSRSIIQIASKKILRYPLSLTQCQLPQPGLPKSSVFWPPFCQSFRQFPHSALIARAASSAIIFKPYKDSKPLQTSGIRTASIKMEKR